MRYVDEYRDPVAARRWARAIARRATRPWTLMEVCGGQTHAIVRFGIDTLLPEGITLLHGPGCPVCVTPRAAIDAAIGLSLRPDVVLCSYGDMLRVPGTDSDLQRARAEGGDVRAVTSPLECLTLARAHPERVVVFFAVGFETTAPAHALLVERARAEGLDNVALLTAQVCVPPALEAILADPERRVDGFLAAGHVCAVTGSAAYAPIAARHRVPIVVTGFEPLDLLEGIHRCVAQLEDGRHEVENAYGRSARDGGNPAAMAMVERVFEPVDRVWRGMGLLPASGWGLRPEWAAFDAASRFGLPAAWDEDVAQGCWAGDVLRGKLRPDRCPSFGTRCTPETPLGAPMVSGEGACAAYFRYGRGVPLPVAP